MTFQDRVKIMFNFALYPEVCRIYVSMKQDVDFHRRDDWQIFYIFMARNMMKLERIFNQAKQALE